MNHSLEHFRTIAFDHKLMAELIRFRKYDAGAIEAAYWFAIVPDVYKEQVEEMVKKTFESIHRQKSSPQLLQQFICDLHKRIWNTLEPILPGAT